LKNELPSGSYAMNVYPKVGDRTSVDVVYFAVKNLTSITGTVQSSHDTLWDQFGFLQIAHWLAYFGLLALLGGIWF
jgi:copper transport protein